MNTIWLFVILTATPAPIISEHTTLHECLMAARTAYIEHDVSPRLMHCRPAPNI